MNDTYKGPIIITTPEALEEIVEKAVERAIQKAGASHEGPAEVLNRKQVAELVGVHPRTIPTLVKRHALPTLRRIGPQWRFRRSAVLAWLATQS